MDKLIKQEDDIWGKALGLIQAEMGEDVLKTWFQQTSLESINGKKATIIVPNAFFGNWLGKHYRQVIGEALQKSRTSSEGVVELDFVVGDRIAAAVAPVQRTPWVQEDNHRQTRRSSLNPKSTFENFVVGDSNNFAHAASLAVADAPAQTYYNPLFIYGGVGLGKTHLLHSIGNFIRQKRDLQIAYVTSEQFMNEMIASLRHNRMPDFRRRYRSIDVLLLDDVQFFGGKDSTQEEFFHTFNALHETQKQIVLSSDLYPKEMLSMKERLRTRFEIGVLAALKRPDFETRIAILRKKSEEEGIAVGEDVVLLLAEGLTRNVRELEGALTRLGAYSTLTGQTVTTDIAKTILEDLLVTVKIVVSPAGVQEIVARRFNVKVSELKSKRRTKALVHPRQIAMYLSRELTNSSFPEIGREFGGKDHTTIMHACRQIEKAMDGDHALKNTLDSLKDEIGRA